MIIGLGAKFTKRKTWQIGRLLKLPDARQLTVAPEKITAYLLLSTHREGGPKLGFFSRFGFSLDRWEEFAEALAAHGQEHDVIDVAETPYGIKYVLEGPLQTPDGRNPDVRTVWLIEYGASHPRFITAVPI